MPSCAFAKTRMPNGPQTGAAGCLTGKYCEKIASRNSIHGIPS
jgi:hypothetical protein